MHQSYTSITASGTASYDLMQISPTATTTQLAMAEFKEVIKRGFLWPHKNDGWTTTRQRADWTNPPRIEPRDRFRARLGFQQMARIPCYRGVRPR